MITERKLFLEKLGMTSHSPVMLQVKDAKGVYITDKKGKKYIDLISGISVSNAGHSNAAIIKAIKAQAEKHLHVMVYGEYVQSPQVKFARMLTDLLPGSLNSVYLVNSGSEAVEGAIKLAKRYTGRFEILSFENAYHGSTHGALSLMGNEKLKNPFRPLLPGVKFLRFNNISDIEKISTSTACVIVEPIQGEAGIIVPENKYLDALRRKCSETGTLLVFDEIQTGFGRTGKLFAFQKFGVLPDILTIAKGIAGGLPLGAFIAEKKIMTCLSENPALGHITTFGGHPLSCAAAIANLRIVSDNMLLDSIKEKEQIFRRNLKHSAIMEIRGTGLMLAVQLQSNDLVMSVIKNAYKRGLLTDWFLFCDSALRIAPPLIISEKEIINACCILIEAIDEAQKRK